MNDLKYRLQKLMQGRYGMDTLSRDLSFLLLAYTLLTMFTSLPYRQSISLVLLFFICFRIYSRNISARYQENMKYLNIRNKFLKFFHNGIHFSKIKQDLEQRRIYHIYRCPRCGQKIRIPRGKGNIMVRCPRCSYEFHKKS